MGSHMTNEKRNTAIMAKIERYTQHHTATPDLAQEAIERIAMTNDKDSAMLVEDFEIIVGSKHHETKVSQSELLRLINGGAKIHHIKALRQPAQSDVLREALEGVLPYVLTNYFRCNGDKCRHPTCASCFGEDFAESQSDKANLALSKAKAAIAALQGRANDQYKRMGRSHAFSQTRCAVGWRRTAPPWACDGARGQQHYAVYRRPDNGRAVRPQSRHGCNVQDQRH
jgi:hypothetical protein